MADLGALDTPRTAVGDATYLSRPPDFDMTQEPSFQSPAKDGDLLQQMRNGRSGGVNLRTPRGSRAPLGDKRNLPAGIGGAEFTPMLKSATRNSARRYGKENVNGMATPALGKIDEDMDMTSVPVESSLYGPSRRSISYVDATPIPVVDSSSIASTPLVLPPRRNGDKGPLNDGNQLSLREQENVIDRIEKENFGLKLKIHFLEEALRKAGPGFSEAALKENTELKVDKVTMQRELHKYKKQLINAEKDLETYQQQILEIQEKAKKKYADESQKIEIEKLQRRLEEKEADIEDLHRQLEQGHGDSDKLDHLQDEISDLEADLRQKDREINEREEELEAMKDKADEAEEKWKSAERHIVELEEKAETNDELHEAKETIEDLEASIRRFEQQVDELTEKLEQANTDKQRAEGDLEELQEEMGNKSMVTKGLSRQMEEKVARLHSELEKAQAKCTSLEQTSAEKEKTTAEIKAKAKQLLQQRDSWEEAQKALSQKVEELQKDLNTRTDEKNLLQLRHDALGDESTSLQRDIAQLRKQIEELEDNLDQEKSHALQIEQEVRDQCKADIDHLNDEITDLQAEIREKDNLYDNDSEKWETEKHNLQSERDRAEERANGLQRTIDKLQEVEGSLSTKELKLQEALNSESERHKNEQAVLSRQIDDLRQDLEARQAMLTELRKEVSSVRDELRQSQLDYQAQVNKAQGLEDEIEVLQATLDEETEQANQNLDKSRKECESLRESLRALRLDADDARATGVASQQTSRQISASLTRLQDQLSDAHVQLSKAGKEKKSFQDQLAALNAELASLRAALATTHAERDEAEEQLRRLRDQDNDTFRLDQERIDLRAAKIKLDGEVKRLREENHAVTSERETLERSLEDEIQKAAEEEERLNSEIVQLQTKIRQSSGSESHQLATARRTIRDLERKTDDLEAQIAVQSASRPQTAEAEAMNNSEFSSMRRDLSDARQKELQLLQHEASHKDEVRGLKRQIADLERRLHDAEMTALIASPNASSASNSASARKQEAVELRRQLSAAQQSLRDSKQKLREAERSAAKKAAEQDKLIQELQAQLDDVEDEKIVLEESLSDAQRAALEAKSKQEKTIRKLEHQVYKLEHRRASQGRLGTRDDTNDLTMEPTERKELRAMLVESQAEIKALEHDIRQQQALINSHEATQQSLRQKLDKVRSERAAYQSSAAKLARDCERLKEGAQEAIEWIEAHKSQLAQPRSQSQFSSNLPDSAAYAAAKDMARSRGTTFRYKNGVDPTVEMAVIPQTDHEAVIRAADDAARRHEKELRGMAMQMKWMQARWEREARLRGDAAYAKRFLELRLEVAEACNKADLRLLSKIHADLGLKSPAALLLSQRQDQPGQSHQSSQRHNSSNSNNNRFSLVDPSRERAQRNLRVFASALRAVVRMQIGASEWAKQEKTRLKLVAAWSETKRREPTKRRWSVNSAAGRSGSDGEGNGEGGSGEEQRRKGRGGRGEEGRRRTRRPYSDGDAEGDDDCVEVRF